MRHGIVIGLTVCLFFLSSSVFAASYYVSVSGDDQNSGISPSTPWQHCPGMPGWTGSGTITSGDTVFFRSQDTWAAGAGSDEVLRATAGVTYDGGTYGSGTRAKLQATGALNAAIVTIYTSNVIFRNFEVDGNNQGCSGIGIHWPTSTSNISNITVDNCVIHDVGSGDNFWYGLVVGSLNNHTLAAVTISNCTVYNTVHEGIVLYPDSSSSSNIVSNATVRGCEVYNTGTANENYGAGILIKNHVNGATIEFNHLHNNILDGVQFETAPGVAGPTGVKVRHNLIRENRRWGLYVLNGGNQTFDFEFYGNLLVNNGQAGISQCGAAIINDNGDYGISAFKLYNNTFYLAGNAGSDKYGFLIPDTLIGTPTIELMNNIFYVNDHTAVYDGTGGKITRGYNLFYRTSGASGTLVNDGGGTFNGDTIRNWDLHAQNGDPQLVNTSDLPTGINPATGPNTNGLNIQLTSPAKDTGISLGDFYNTSINGVNRPNGAGWDIGAYEAAKPKPSPPKNLRIVN